MKAELANSVERRKDAMIASLWSNSNYDDDKGTRQKAIDEIEANYDEAIVKIHAGPLAEEEDQIDKDNPFFSAIERGQRKLETPRNDEGKVADVAENDFTKFIDQ